MWGSQLQIQLKINISVVLFDLISGSTPALEPSMFHLSLLWSFFLDDQQPYVIFKIECFVPLLHSKWSDLKNSFIIRGHFSQMIIWSTNSPMLSSKLNVLCHNSVPSPQNWKSYSQTGVIFETIILSTNNATLSSKLNILSHITVYLNIICSVSN